MADHRESATGLVDRLTSRGFDLIAYDSRAHGMSEGDACRYGYFERIDLSRALDDVGVGPIVLIGTSLGASVALHTAADDRRLTVVVAAEAFSSLQTVATERTPFIFTRGIIRDALSLAEREGRFTTDAVNPAAAAARVTAPTLLIHGNADVDTPPTHSRRIYVALRGPKRFILVPGAGTTSRSGRTCGRASSSGSTRRCPRP